MAIEVTVICKARKKIFCFDFTDFFLSSFLIFYPFSFVAMFFVCSGWGKIKHPGSSHHILQQANLPPVTNSECAKKLASSPGRNSRGSLPDKSHCFLVSIPDFSHLLC